MKTNHPLITSKSTIIRNALTFIWRTAPAHIVGGILLAILLCLVLYLFSYKGVRIIYRFDIIGPVLVSRLLHLFFMSVFFMLIFSSVIISFATFFRSSETEYLMTTPLPYRTVYQTKLAESCILTTWAFFFLLIPFIAALGKVMHVEIIFFMIATIYSFMLAIIACALGSHITLILSRFFPRQRIHIFIIGVIIIIGWLYYTAHHKRFIWKTFELSSSIAMINSLVPNVELAQTPWLPNFWFTKGLLFAANKNYPKALFYLLLMSSTALMLLRAGEYMADAMYHTAWNRIQSSTGRETIRRAISTIDKLSRLWSFTRRPVKALISKDLKLFWRDPLQKSQFLIFFGLVSAYFLNIRNLESNMHISVSWRTIVWFLNLGAVNLTLGALSTRFTFPQLSLEGRRFWVVGLAPISLRTLLWEKFWISAGGAVIITELVMFSASLLLHMNGLLLWGGGVVTFFMSFALAGLAVGMGAMFPNFHEDNPNRIVSGFGGTLTLSLSLIYVIGAIFLLAAPIHWFLNGALSYANFLLYIKISGGLFIVISIATCLLPLFLGERSLSKREL